MAGLSLFAGRVLFPSIGALGGIGALRCVLDKHLQDVAASDQMVEEKDRTGSYGIEKMPPLYNSNMHTTLFTGRMLHISKWTREEKDWSDIALDDVLMHVFAALEMSQSEAFWSQENHGENILNKDSIRKILENKSLRDAMEKAGCLNASFLRLMNTTPANYDACDVVPEYHRESEVGSRENKWSRSTEISDHEELEPDIQHAPDVKESAKNALAPVLKASVQSTFVSKIIHGDVLEQLKCQPDDIKFDVVIADPPYNIGKDFGNNSDNMHINDYVKWSVKWINKCLKLLAHNGVVYVYGFPEILARIAVQYSFGEQRWLAWHYTNKAVPSSTFWQRSHESILCLWEPGTKRPVLEIDQIREPYSETFLNNASGKVRKGTHGRFGGKSGRETIYKAHEGGALPRDVIKIPALAGGAGASERWFMCLDCDKQVFAPSEIKNHREHDTLKHPTQKPLALTKRLIQSRINGNQGRTLVPFAGSGSECVAAKELGVEYLGIELNPLYVDFANQWLKHV